jgi:hypothetical protein
MEISTFEQIIAPQISIFSLGSKVDLTCILVYFPIPNTIFVKNLLFVKLENWVRQGYPP